MNNASKTGRSVESWWAWHDADAARWSDGENPDEATREAEARCAAWVAGDSDDGPDGTMTKSEAIEYVRSCGEDDGPETYEDAAEVFVALYGRRPDDSDGDRGNVWSHCCAAVEAEPVRVDPKAG